MLKMTSMTIVLLTIGAATMAGCSSNHGASAANEGGTNDRSTIASGAPYRAPAWATADHFLGRVDPSSRLTVHVHLAMHDEEGARALLRDVSDPASQSYGHFLTTEEYNARFAPSSEDVAVVRAHLEASGLSIAHVPSNRAYIEVEGPVSAIETAFGTRLGRYSHADGERHSPLEAPTLPAAVSGRVRSVLGLSTPPRAKPARTRKKPPSAGAAATPTCSTYYGEYRGTTSDPPFGRGYEDPLPLALCTDSGYSPAQLRQAYGFAQAVAEGLDGRGQTVATIDAWQAPTFLSDVETYASQQVPPQPFIAGQLITRWTPGVATPEPPDDNWEPEQDLDVEAVHAIAPGATIAYTAAQSDSEPDLLAAFNYVVADNLASIISFSAGWPESQETESAAWESMAIQAGLKGIGLYSGSGDYGDWVLLGGLPAPTATFPNSLPEFTSVGGTSLALGRDGERVFELGFEQGISQILPTECGGDWAIGPTCPGDGGVPYDGGAPEGGSVAWWPANPGGYYGGAGGGPSVFFAQPSYQRGVVPPSIAGVRSPMRVTPDVAMLADWSIGFMVGITFQGQYQVVPVGGTSLSGPLFAATIALAQQTHGHRYGSGNAAFYRAANRGGFRDIAPAERPQADLYPATLAVPYPLYDAYGEDYLVAFDYHGPENTLATAVGYDDVTGVGAPAGAAFLAALP